MDGLAKIQKSLNREMRRLEKILAKNYPKNSIEYLKQNMFTKKDMQRFIPILNDFIEEMRGINRQSALTLRSHSAKLT